MIADDHAGWNIYNVSVPSANDATPAYMNMDQAFHAWHTSVSNNWDAIVDARQQYRQEVVLPSIRAGRAEFTGSAGDDVSTALPTTRFAPEAGVVQIIDGTQYPNNPSCPFPTPAAVPVHH